MGRCPSRATRLESYPTRPGAAPSRLDAEAFKVIEAAHARVYGVPCYGIGPIADTEDGALGFGADSDQERILEEGLLKFVRVHFEIVRDLAAAR